MTHPYINIAVKAARRAGTIILRSLDQLDTLTISEKAHNDYVTNIDQTVERDIVETIRRAYPRHAILGEEGTALEDQGENSDRNRNERGKGRDEDRQGECVWIIDPIDGTLNFIHGYPQMSISIAIQRAGQIEHGLVYDPLRDEIFTATKGEGAQLNGRKIRVSRQHRIQQALIATGFPVRKGQKVLSAHLKQLETILKTVADVRRAGSAALDLAYVATGRLDGYWEQNLQIWDIAAGALLVQEAGGYVSDFSSGNEYLECGNIIAGNPKIQPHLARILSESE